MRVWVPEAVSRLGTLTARLHYTDRPYSGGPPVETCKIMWGCDLPEYRYVIDDENYFYNTHHRPMNDCVHSKRLVDGSTELAPSLIDQDGWLYIQRFHNCWGHWEWFDNPLDPNSEHHINNLYDERYVNDKNTCYVIQLRVNSGRNKTVQSTCNIRCWYAVPKKDKTDYDKIYYLNVTFYLTLAWSTSWYDSTTRREGQGASFSGEWRRIGNTKFPIDDTLPLYVGTRLSGLTDTYHKSGTSWGHDYFMPGLFEPIAMAIFDKCENAIQQWFLDGILSKWSGWSVTGFRDYNRVKRLTLPELVPVGKRFLLHENERIVEGLDPYLIDRHGLPNYWFNVLVQNAYLDALDSTPRLNDNSISNILEIAGFMKSLIIDHKIDIPKSLGDIWLSYRYQYTTSKLDAEEAISFVHRHLDLGTLDQWIHCFGVSRHHYVGVDFEADIVCRCGLEIRPSDVAMLGKVWRAMYTYGLQPNFYVVWDMVPYSFIVDWFIPIGNLAHALDAQSMYEGTYYKIKDVVFSLSYDITDEYQNTYHQYSRWTQDGVPQLNGFYFLEEDPTSTKVKGMRALDALSLFIGKGKKR